MISRSCDGVKVVNSEDREERSNFPVHLSVVTSSPKYSLLERIFFASRKCNKRKLAEAVSGKTILITGVSRGIGRAIFEQLGKFDCYIVGVSRSEEDLQAMHDAFQGKARFVHYALDLRDVQQRQEFLDTLRREHIAPDILIHNAGKSIRRSVFEAQNRFHDYQRTMDLNYFAPVDLTLQLLPELKKRKAHIIQMSSVSVRLATAPKWSAYQASKAAFDQWFRSVEPEFEAAGMHCTSIYPPLVRTDMVKPTKEYDKIPAMRPEHVADIVCRKIVTKGRMYRPWWLIFGEINSVLFAKFWLRSMKKRMRKRGEG